MSIRRACGAGHGLFPTVFLWSILLLQRILAVPLSSVTTAEESSDALVAATTTSSGGPSSVTQAQRTTMTVTTAPLPIAFDTSTMIGTFANFSCQNFFYGFLTDPVFRSCVPFSLLLSNSNAFSEATKDPQALNKILSASCSVDFPLCKSYFSQLATNITRQDTCAQDLAFQSPSVVSAYTGALAYESMYHAACLRDPGLSSLSVSPTSTLSSVSSTASVSSSTDASLLFARALPEVSSGSSSSPLSESTPSSSSNTTSAADSTPTSSSSSSASSPAHPYCYALAISIPTQAMLYTIPLGYPLTTLRKQDCTPCVRETIASYAPFASNVSLPISSGFTGSVRTVERVCGRAFLGEQVLAQGLGTSKAGDLQGSAGRLGLGLGGYYWQSRAQMSAWRRSGLAIMAGMWSCMVGMGLVF